MSPKQRGKIYVGIHNDEFGGMTPTGTIIKDAWTFGILPETETCEGWDIGRMQLLYEKTSELWEQFGYRVTNLPADMRERHERIHREAMARARASGWLPDAMIDAEEN
ncbi:hypothetical protein [Acidihalobacter ferrooxydans]|uniref:Uncharacterized protein n=1 Tax=Acidihalobacter ferrooxydans TaxID=1765967 RepID=A0A1P8UIN9_9GAMM|nr:hypothetical protein [Acidihalobacter ferrooxydans]APZ43631.1 hypothetical protein BW247_11480 [Acidihalobacter ferrooxydans]